MKRRRRRDAWWTLEYHDLDLVHRGNGRGSRECTDGREFIWYMMEHLV